jgi:hypothetical protein
MLCSGAVVAVYIESCSASQGDDFLQVKHSLGGPWAKLSLSALTLNYILMGPVRTVVAGQYLMGLLDDIFFRLGHPLRWSGVQFNHAAGLFAVLATGYFWWKNIRGINKSSEKALRIMQITTVMVLLVILWSVVTLIVYPSPLPPLPSNANIPRNHETLGWLYHSGLANVTWVLMLIHNVHAVERKVFKIYPILAVGVTLQVQLAYPSQLGVRYRMNISYQRDPRCAQRFAVFVFLGNQQAGAGVGLQVLRMHSHGADQEYRTTVIVQSVRHYGTKRESWLFTR